MSALDRISRSEVRRREFKANDPPVPLSVKVASSEKRELRAIAGNRSLPVQELVFEPRLVLGGSSGFRQGRESTAREEGGESETI